MGKDQESDRTMSYFIFDSNEYVGFLSNRNGRNAMSNFLSPTSKTCRQFFDEGCTKDLEEMKKALDSVIVIDQALHEMIEDLRVMIDQSEDIAIISDGWVEDTEGLHLSPESPKKKIRPEKGVNGAIPAEQGIFF